MLKKGQSRSVLILVLLLLLLIPRALEDSEPLPVQLVDDGNRAITLPETIAKIYATTEEGLFLVYALDPESILGWNRGLSPEMEFAVLPEYRDLPTLGTWDTEYQTARWEAIDKLEPDLIIHYSPCNEANKNLVSEISAALGVPAVLIDNSLQALPNSLRLLGTLLNKEIRGQALAAFVENQLRQALRFQDLRSFYNPIPVHIVSSAAEGCFDELLEYAGMEEMHLWSDQPPFPDFVLIMPHQISDPYRTIERDGHKRIYQIPSFPSNWLNPGSIFALLGIEWLHSIAYPQSYPGDLPETYRAFMEVFFQINITPELLAWTLHRSGISY